MFIYKLGSVVSLPFPSRQAATDAAFSLFSGPVGGLVVRPV